LDVKCPVASTLDVNSEDHASDDEISPDKFNRSQVDPSDAVVDVAGLDGPDTPSSSSSSLAGDVAEKVPSLSAERQDSRASSKASSHANFRNRWEDATAALKASEYRLQEKDIEASELHGRLEEIAFKGQQAVAEHELAKRAVQDQQEQLAALESLTGSLRDEMTQHQLAQNVKDIDGNFIAEYRGLEEALRTAKEHTSELHAQLEDKDYAMQIMSEACAEDGGEPVGIREARRLRSECAELQVELQEASASDKNSGAPTTQLPPRILEKEAGGFSAFVEESTRRLPPAIQEEEEEDENAKPGTTTSRQTAMFGTNSDISQEPWSPTADFVADRQPSFANEDVARTASASSRGSPLNDFREAIADVAPDGMRFAPPQRVAGTDADELEGLREQLAYERQQLAAERQQLASERAAYADAREEAERTTQALAEANDGGSDVERLRMELTEEAAKSRRLLEHALRAEESRRRLLLELSKDAGADADFAALAKVIGRAAKAIATISREAPLVPLDEPPKRSTAAKAAVAGPSSTRRTLGALPAVPQQPPQQHSAASSPTPPDKPSLRQLPPVPPVPTIGQKLEEEPPANADAGAELL